jgi:hypothetical protein
MNTRRVLCLLMTLLSAKRPLQRRRHPSQGRSTPRRSCAPSPGSRRAGTPPSRRPPRYSRELSERELGAKITKCWLNLDEMWDYRTRTYDYNYRIASTNTTTSKGSTRKPGRGQRDDVRFEDYLQASARTATR